MADDKFIDPAAKKPEEPGLDEEENLEEIEAEAEEEDDEDEEE
ncbi:MAG: hypothetical protein WCJ29_01485 [bacterium]